MRRRFSRRRRPSDSGAPAFDAQQAMQRLVEEKIVGVPSLEPVQGDDRGDVPDDYAALGLGGEKGGRRTLVSFSPSHGGDALLAGIAAARKLGETSDEPSEAGAGAAVSTRPFDGEVLVIAPQWSAAARRRLALVGDQSFRIRALAASSLGDAPDVEPESAEFAPVLPIDQVVAQVARPADRELFGRAAAALEGLASKHGGAVRGRDRSVELVVLARRVAELRAEDGRITLHSILPQRSSTPLDAEGLAGAFDRLEGNLRKRLNDRRARDGEEGMRTRMVPLLATAHGLRGLRGWPLGGADQETIDLVGVDADGRAVVGAIRQRLTLRSLGEILDAAMAARPLLPLLLGGLESPVRFDDLRIVLAAEELSESVANILPALIVGHDLYEIRSGRGRGYELALVGSGEAARKLISRPGRRSRNDRGRDNRGREDRGREDRGRDAARPDEVAADSESARAPDDEASGAGEESAEAPGTRSRRRGGRRGRRGGAAASGADRERSTESDDRPERTSRRTPRFDEISLFDLDDESRDSGSSDSEEGGRRATGRRRSRRRGGRRGATDTDDAESEPTDAVEDKVEASASSGPQGRRRRSGRRSERDDASESDEEPVDDVDIELSDSLVPLADAPELDDEAEAPLYEEDEDLGEDSDPDDDRRAIDREKRRLARSAEAEAEVPKQPQRPRRRAAIVVHADRESVLAAVLLARDIRLVEGIWVYQQADLMTFFRSVTTDLRDDTPIYVVGFRPSPAHEVLQSASLYSNRLVWFDHHEWPPEDLGALRETIGEDNVHVTPGAETPLPALMGTSTRRSRFTDKLVDLGMARFTQHDFERWGRLWWWRLGEIAGRSGESKSEVESLLAGRPSDLAKEAAKLEPPPLPAELAYVSERDFRLVHFSGYSMIVAEVEPGLDLHLTARIARERYGAALSLAYYSGGELVVFGGDDLQGRRSLDLSALVEHLATKHAWVEALSDADHVARFLVRDLATTPGRIDEVVGEIAMGRSIIER